MKKAVIILLLLAGFSTPIFSQTKAPGVYGPSLLADTTLNEYKSSSVKFTPTITKAGAYNVFVYCPRTKDGTTKLTVTMFDGKTKNDVVLSPNDAKVEGQTSGEWIGIDKGMDGIIVADAVLFVPAK